jgi:iron(III) transport system substrate-binding protein
MLHHLTGAMILATLVGAGGATGVAAQSADPSAIYLYQGADRAERLAAKAREEGTLMLYTSMATTESGPLAAAFEKKYGVKVQLWRALSENVLQRALTEARSGRRGMDVVETNAPEVEALAREQVVAQFDTPYLTDLPPWAIPPHRRWLSDRANLWVTGYNTDKLKRDELPTALKPQMRKGHILVAQLVAAGEMPVCLTIYSGNADSIKAKGGPIDWLAVEPLVGRPQALALAKNAPHPHAALLFADFVLSPEGQKLLADMGRNPSSRTQQTLLDRHRHSMIDPVKWLDQAPKWEKLWTELFLK